MVDSEESRLYIPSEVEVKETEQPNNEPRGSSDSDNVQSPNNKPTFFQKTQISPPICFIAAMSGFAYIWLYIALGPNCLSAIILSASFILAFTISAYVIYYSCAKENWFYFPSIFLKAKNDEADVEEGVAEESTSLRYNEK